MSSGLLVAGRRGVQVMYEHDLKTKKLSCDRSVVNNELLSAAEFHLRTSSGVFEAFSVHLDDSAGLWTT